ncbi:MAG: polysaccharide export protein [Desulfobacteraceae bacterium]|nr:polysaccharide export protein [Desulfobacteraceae bacterium]
MILVQVFILIFHGISPAQNKAYVIGPRDVLSLTIYAGGEKQHEVDITVTADGQINVPFIGSVRAQGLSTSELENSITKPLAKDYFVNPEINIQIKEYHSLSYYISGAVNSPGLYEMTSKATILKLIAKAGGVLSNRGNVAYILRDSTKKIEQGEVVENLISRNEPIRVDLIRLLDKGDMTHNKILQSGDVVYIPPQKALHMAESNIYVEGKVRNPGVYPYQPGLTALSACIMAGGFGKYAAPNRTKIIRKKGGERITIDIDLNKVKKGKIPDIELEPGDLINVDESWL